MRIHECPICQGKISLKKIECRECGVSFEGDIYTSPIANLPQDYQKFIELFILHSGSLKEMARILGVTYPTIRLKLNHIIGQLRKEVAEQTQKEDRDLQKNHG